MSSAVAELLRSFATVLEQLGLRWYLFGAQAAVAYGSARLSADVDVTVDLGASELSTLVTALERSGFRLRVSNVEDFAKRTRVVPMVYEDSGMPIDIVLAGPGPEELFLQRAMQRTIEGVVVRVACPEDVVVMKILAGRPKDLDDAEAVLAAHPSDLDLDLVRGTLQLLQEALAQSDLLPAFERTLKRTQR